MKSNLITALNYIAKEQEASKSGQGSPWQAVQKEREVSSRFFYRRGGGDGVVVIEQGGGRLVDGNHGIVCLTGEMLFCYVCWMFIIICV